MEGVCATLCRLAMRVRSSLLNVIKELVRSEEVIWLDRNNHRKRSKAEVSGGILFSLLMARKLVEYIL